MARNDRRARRQEVLRLLAQLFQSRAHYESELARTGYAVHPTVNLSAYRGPIPATMDDVIRHVTDRGIAPDTVHPELSSWAAQFAPSVPLPAPATVAPTEEENPVEEGTSVPALVGDETPSTTPAEPALPLTDVDVEMHE